MSSMFFVQERIILRIGQPVACTWIFLIASNDDPKNEWIKGVEPQGKSQQPAKMIILRQPQPLLVEWRVQWDCCCFRWIIRRKISMSWRRAAYCELSRCSDRVSLLKCGRLTGVPSLLQCISDHNAGQVAQITYHPICRNNWISACCSLQSVHSADYHDLALATKRAAISFDAQRTVPPRWINK